MFWKPVNGLQKKKPLSSFLIGFRPLSIRRVKLDQKNEPTKCLPSGIHTKPKPNTNPKLRVGVRVSFMARFRFCLSGVLRWKYPWLFCLVVPVVGFSALCEADVGGHATYVSGHATQTLVRSLADLGLL